MGGGYIPGIYRHIEIPGIYLVYTLLSTWPGHHPSPWPTHPHQAPTNHGQCTGMHSALVGHTCTTINCNFCKLAFTPQGAPPYGQICPCSPCAPPPAGPRGPQAASPKIGIYQQPIFGGGYILGIYGYIQIILVYTIPGIYQDHIPAHHNSTQKLVFHAPAMLLILK